MGITNSAELRSHTPKGTRARDKILRVAERLLASAGFYGTSMRDVADAAGVPLASVVYHFAKKEQLYAAVLTEIGDHLVSEMTRALHDEDQPWAARLDTIVRDPRRVDRRAPRAREAAAARAPRQPGACRARVEAAAGAGPPAPLRLRGRRHPRGRVSAHRPRDQRPPPGRRRQLLRRSATDRAAHRRTGSRSPHFRRPTSARRPASRAACSSLSSQRFTSMEAKKQIDLVKRALAHVAARTTDADTERGPTKVRAASVPR